MREIISPKSLLTFFHVDYPGALMEKCLRGLDRKHFAARAEKDIVGFRQYAVRRSFLNSGTWKIALSLLLTRNLDWGHCEKISATPLLNKNAFLENCRRQQ